MTKGTTFNSKNQTWKISEVIEASDMIRSIGWTHVAAVTRPNGSKVYYANLMVVDGAILQSMVVC